MSSCLGRLLRLLLGLRFSLERLDLKLLALLASIFKKYCAVKDFFQRVTNISFAAIQGQTYKTFRLSAHQEFNLI
jgi:hypothetical protein